MVKRIDIIAIERSDNKITFRLKYSNSLKKYLLKDTFFVEYSDNVNISNVDESILVIPILSALAPITWVVGADIFVNKVDQQYLYSLSQIEDDFQKQFFVSTYKSEIKAKQIVSNKFCGKKSGLLFSGGLDSITSYILHKDEKPDLISVLGHDIRLHEKKVFSKIKEKMRWVQNSDEVTVIEVRTNLEYLNVQLLNWQVNLEFPWTSTMIAGGLILLGITAPITAARGLSTVFISSNITKEYDTRCMCHKQSQDKITWADVVVDTTGSSMSRQQKIKYILKEAPRFLSSLKVCRNNMIRNCMKCEKCIRTAIGLTLEGLDPIQFGFSMNMGVFKRAKNMLVKGIIKHCDEDGWQDIQRHISIESVPDLYGSRQFFEWLKSYQFTSRKCSKIRSFVFIMRLDISRLAQIAVIYGNLGEEMRYLNWLIISRFYWLVSVLKESVLKKIPGEQCDQW